MKAGGGCGKQCEHHEERLNEKRNYNLPLAIIPWRALMRPARKFLMK